MNKGEHWDFKILKNRVFFRNVIFCRWSKCEWQTFFDGLWRDPVREMASVGMTKKWSKNDCERDCLRECGNQANDWERRLRLLAAACSGIVVAEFLRLPKLCLGCAS